MMLHQCKAECKNKISWQEKTVKDDAEEEEDEDLSVQVEEK